MPACVDEVRPLALLDARARRTRKLYGMVAGARIQNEDVDPARETREGTRQIALFVARQNDCGD